MQNKKILVTGASGFIGSHLTKRLNEEGYKVIAPSKLDIVNKKQVSKLPKTDLVIHLAAIVNVPLSWDKPEDIFKVNTLGTLNILKYCEKNKSGIIYASSYVYGNPKYLPIDENHPISLENPYAISKFAAEQLCYMYGKKNNFPVTVFRIFNPYGPGQSPNMVISQMLSDLIANNKIEILDKTPKRDFVYIDDVIDVFILTLKMKLEGYNLFNIGSGKAYSIYNIAKKIIKISGSKNTTILDRKIKRSNDIPETKANILKVKKHLKWKPRIDINDGLERTYKWASRQN